MHSANIEKSARLQRVLNRLYEGPATTLELVRDANVCAVNSIISEIRNNGYQVDCSCVGRGKFIYSLVGKSVDISEV